MHIVDAVVALMGGGDYGQEEERDIIVHKIDGNL